MDLATYSTMELCELQQQIPAELKRRASREKSAILAEIRELVKAKGYTLDELLDREVKTRASSPVRVKYRHPNRSELEWTGRGRKPKWVEMWLAEGGVMEGLAV